jgi:hypothetical protein
MVGGPPRSHVGPVAVVALLVVAAVVAALGGLRESPARRRRQLAPGQSVDTAQWRVRPLRAWIGDRCPLAPAGLPAPAEPCLSLEVELTNLTRASSNDVADALTLVDPRLPPSTRPQLMLARDRGVLFQLHPKMPERVVASWKLPAGSHPRAATLVIRGKRFKERDNLIGGEGWFDPKPVAEARLALAVEAAPPATEAAR